MNGFTFNGTTSQSLGLLVTALNPYNSASRRVETIEIPYRNGNLIIDSGTYDNIMVSYEVSVIGNTKNTCDAVNEWLSGSQGYCILSDTVNTEFFRVGYFASSIEYVLTALYRYGKATLNFDCFPQKYLNSNTTITRSATSTTTTGEGGTFSSKVYPLPIDLKGNTIQSGTPTPSSPQTIHNVSGDNDVNVTGINRFRPRDFTHTQDGITVTYDSETQTFTFNGTCTQDNVLFQLGDIPVNVKQNTTRMYVFWAGGSVTTYCTMRLHDSTYTYNLICDLTKLSASYLVESSGTKPYDFIAPPNLQTIRFDNGSVATNFKIRIMVSDVTVNEYEPYVGNTYRLTLPVELNKIGDYQDYIYKNGSKWYWHREVGRAVLRETDAWEDRPTYTYADRFVIPNKISALSGSHTGYCDYFEVKSNSNNTYPYIDTNTTQVICNYSASGTTTLAQFKTWIGEHQPVLYYVLATPTNTEITDATLLSQLNAIDNVMAFETSTTITQVNNDAPFLLTYTNIGSANVSSDYRGEPIITVNETGMIYINGVNVKVLQAPMTINSQTMQAYNGTVNLNNYVELNEFPMLKKGNNDIGSTMALSIVPNYWKL